MRMPIEVYVIYAILMYLYIHTFYYLKKAELTGCFNPKTVNLKFMEFFQILEIIAVTITILFFPSFIKKRKRYIAITLIAGLVVLLINMYMAFNVYNFYYELKQCSIMNKWNKWWLYWEGIIAAISSIRGILALILIAMIGLKIVK